MNQKAMETESPTKEVIRAKILADASVARLHVWGVAPYERILRLQEKMRDVRRGGTIPDTWLAGEHETVITQGVRGGAGDLTAEQPGFPIFQIDRGGQTTLHNPGQLVIYLIVKTQPGLLAQGRLARTLLGATRDWIAQLSGVELEIHKGRPGLFNGERKVAAIGISIHNHVSMHGIAINLCNDLSAWGAIIPCGEPGVRPQTLSEAAGREIAPKDFIERMPEWLRQTWGYGEVRMTPTPDEGY